jgi:16S rRNA (guanine(966)-N(2))-methyltransferase RsmD
MRIITGTARGKRLQTPQGLHTRPTTDRVKESVFNIIQWDIEGRKVLDLFGGSGQLGLEALSRGAASCVIVDGDRNAQKAIEANIKNCGFERNCQLIKGDSFRFLQRLKKDSFHLIFLDPPYGGELLNRAIAEICRIDILSEGGIMVCESAASDPLDPVTAPYHMVKQYSYGNIVLTIITKGDTE